MDFVDDVDLQPPLGGHVARSLAQGAHVVDAGIRGAIYLDDIDRTPGRDLLAGFAHATGIRRGSLLTAQGLGQNPRRAGLAHPARAREQKGVMDAIPGDGVGQRARDVFLPDQLGKTLGPILTGQDQIRHGGVTLANIARWNRRGG